MFSSSLLQEIEIEADDFPIRYEELLRCINNQVIYFPKWIIANEIYFPKWNGKTYYIINAI